MRALAALLLVPACFSPQLPECSVHCGPTSPCPADLTCGADQFCHTGGATEVCSTTTLDITVDGGGEGRVGSSPIGVDCTSNSLGVGCELIPFRVGTPVTLTETHTGTNHFSGWSGGACAGSTAAVCTFTIEVPTTINARFD